MKLDGEGTKDRLHVEWCAVGRAVERGRSDGGTACGLWDGREACGRRTHAVLSGRAGWSACVCLADRMPVDEDWGGGQG